jgi:hypothetical protein
MHVYEVRPRRDKRGFDLISDALPFRIYDDAGNKLCKCSPFSIRAQNETFSVVAIGVSNPD